VCQFLYLIIFVPYNLFKLFLAHKISAYNYICGKWEKEMGKEKEKGFPACWAGGVFFAQPSASARAGAVGGPASP
jgi:hypothetical protein